jgi:hypothetical protein
VDWESTLYANLEGDLTNGEGLADSVARATDYNTLEDLHTATVTFNNVYVNLYVVSNAEGRDVVTQVRCVYYVENMHFKTLSVSARRSSTNFR